MNIKRLTGALHMCLEEATESQELPQTITVKNMIKVILEILDGTYKGELENTGWISVKERLPDKYIPVLCASRNSEGKTEYKVSYAIPCMKSMDEREKLFLDESIVAWMPFMAYDEKHEELKRNTKVLDPLSLYAKLKIIENYQRGEKQ